MEKLIIVSILFISLLNKQIPKDIAGEWIVEKVDASNFTANLPQEQKDIVNEKLIKPFTNAVFDFKPNHHFYLSAKLGNMPQDTYWEYNEPSRTIKIKEYNNPKSLIMQIHVVEKDNSILFELHETPIVLKMHKKQN